MIKTLAALTDDRIALDYGLRAQVRLLPYALGFFGIGLPIYIWSGALFVPPLIIALNLCLFALLWLAFFLMKPALRVEGATGAMLPERIDARLRQQWICGGLWALSLMVISLNVIDSGPSAVVFLIVCAGAAAGIIFFSAPILIFLLTLGPLAMAGPIIALHSLATDSDGQQLAHLVTAGLSLALAFGLVLNRHLREHYLLEHRQLELSLDREAMLRTRDELSHAQMSLMRTLSDEVVSGMRGLEQTLTQSLSLLARAPTPKKQIEQALGSVGQILDMVTTTVDDGTARSGHLHVTPEAINLKTLTESLHAGFAPLARAKGLEFVLSSPPPPLTGAVIADPQRVRQILSHLLTNAITYTPSGRVTLKWHAPSDGFVNIEVTDTGPGLNDAELKQAFVPFARVLRTSTGHAGTGLGLSLSRTLTDLMGGRLQAQSTPGLGSIFTLELPFDPQAETPVIETPEDETDNEIPASQTILLLADDRLEEAKLRSLLEQMGHKCLSARNRTRALSLAQQGRLHACLIATNALEDLSQSQNHEVLESYFQSLRDTQADTRLKILALLPDGEQADVLTRMDITPLLSPVSSGELNRALIQSDAE
ncbi:MAG: ATP-binding protein [Asticcacaulis sp.]